MGANQDSVFARLAEAMGQPELATDARYADHVARGEHQDELDEVNCRVDGDAPGRPGCSTSSSGTASRPAGSSGRRRC